MVAEPIDMKTAELMMVNKANVLCLETFFCIYVQYYDQFCAAAMNTEKVNKPIMHISSHPNC